MNKIEQINKRTDGPLIVRILCIILLLWALLPINPYGYYILLRWVCCPCFAYLTLVSYLNGQIPCVWIFAVSAGIYNPIFRVHLGREIWFIVNIISILLLIVHAIISKKGETRSQQKNSAAAL